MPVTFAHLTGVTRHLEIDFLGEKVKLTYKPGELTLVAEQTIADATGTEAAGAAVTDLLCRMVIGWDLEGEEGAAYPITPQSLSVLPSAFLMAVMAAIREDMAPKPRSGRR